MPRDVTKETRHKLIHNPIPTSLFFNLVCFVVNALEKKHLHIELAT